MKPIHTISLDVMGGDKGPQIVISGAAMALQRCQDLCFQLYGNENQIHSLLDKYPDLKAVCQVHHCEIAIAMTDKPGKALRYGRWKSSMWCAIEAVKSGRASICISAGNTGALMAMSKLCLRTMHGIDRPVMAALWPTLRGESIVLDVGATIGANAFELIDYAIMGSAMARALLNINRPSVGLLNVGVEEVKGLEEIREANQFLKNYSPDELDYRGFIEGDDIGKGTVDVIVSEGFSGNIALKAAEGTARQIATYLKNTMRMNLMSRIGYLFSRQSFNQLGKKMDPRRSNGAVFLGLNGIVIKSHGSSDAKGFSYAIQMGNRILKNKLPEKIKHDIHQFKSSNRKN